MSRPESPGTAATTFDIAVIGGGPVGEEVAVRVAPAGRTVALIEAELFGGECHYWACIPSKGLIRSTHALRAAQRLPGSREAVTGPLDTPAVLARRDVLVSHFDDGGAI